MDDDLIGMPAASFREVVVNESKGNADWATEVFTTDLEICERWTEALQWFSQDAMRQLSELKGWHHEMLEDPEVSRQGQFAEYERRRSRIMWFQGKMDERLREAKTIRAELRRQAFN